VSFRNGKGRDPEKAITFHIKISKQTISRYLNPEIITLSMWKNLAIYLDMFV